MASKIQALLAFIIFIITIVIAIPTINFNFRGKNYVISNINPADLNLNLVQNDYSYQPALDLQGGYTIVFDVELTEYEGDKLAQFKTVEKTLVQRMALIGLRDFEFTSFYNLEDNIFQLHLTTPEEVNSDLVQILTSPGRLDVLVNDPEAEVDAESENSTIFDGRKSAEISNSDILKVKVVSDSRIYSSDPEQPNNFGLEVTFKSESRQKLQNALISNYSTGTPLIFTLDGSLVAIQASGQQLNPLQENDTLLLYTFFSDTKLNNSVIGAVMASENLDTMVSAGESIRTSPTLGESALRNIKYISLAVIVIFPAILTLLLKTKSIYVNTAVFIYMLLMITSQKILNLNLSFALVEATYLMLGAFIIGQVHLIILADRHTSSQKSLKEFIEKYTLSGWKAVLSIFTTVPVVLYFQNLLTASVNQFVEVIILGTVILLLYKIFFFPVLFKLFVKSS